jgi:hypothetical protein
MMERLTEDKLYLRSIGFGVLANFSPFCGEERAKESSVFLGKVFDHLAAYEDTNRTPAEITESSRWIPVSERIPEPSECDENGEVLAYDGREEWITRPEWLKHDEMTHWMPLPQPPKEIHNGKN